MLDLVQEAAGQILEVVIFVQKHLTMSNHQLSSIGASCYSALPTSLGEGASCCR